MEPPTGIEIGKVQEFLGRGYAEINAMQACAKALEHLPQDRLDRVIRWLGSALRDDPDMVKARCRQFEPQNQCVTDASVCKGRHTFNGKPNRCSVPDQREKGGTE